MKIDEKAFVDSLHSKGTFGKKNTYDGGSLGLGDPDDKTLNEIEIKTAIPCWEKDIIVRDHCNNENQAYNTCYGDNYFFNRYYTCSAPKQSLNNCIEYWKNRLDLREQATAEYLEERRIYRITGLTKKEREDKTNQREQEGIAQKLVKKIQSVILNEKEIQQLEENLKSRKY